MKAVICTQPGGVEVLQVGELPPPKPAPDEILVRNFATALNRADLLQRRGLYPPPAGASEVLGLEFAGEVAAAGSDVSDFAVGDRVFGLIAGGGYAEYVAVHRSLAVRIPDNLSYDAAAAVPEVFYTAREAMFQLGRLQKDEVVLIHAGASGVGSAAIQLARSAGARVLATAGTPAKVEFCRGLGAERAIHYREERFSEVVRETTGGVDVILDLVGASYWEDNLQCLRDGGRCLIIGLVSGTRAEVDLGLILRRRLQILGTAMRSRSQTDKAAITARFIAEDLPRFQTGELRPIIDRVYPLEEVRAAHSRMEANLNLGKIVLRM